MHLIALCLCVGVAQENKCLATISMCVCLFVLQIPSLITLGCPTSISFYKLHPRQPLVVPTDISIKSILGWVLILQRWWVGHKIYVVEVTLFGVLIYMSDLSSEMMDVCVCV
jgi:hypothetical protein